MSLDSGLSVQDLVSKLGLDPDKRRAETPGLNEFPSSNRVALIAPPSAGKTTIVAGMFMRAQKKVADTLRSDVRFYCRCLEKGSNIRQDVSNLLDGYFPAKTQTYLGFRSSPGLLLELQKVLKIGNFFGRDREQLLWHKLLQIMFCDLPGETLSQVMWQVRLQVGTQAQLTKMAIEDAIADMRSCDAYIFILNAALAKGLGPQLETEKDQTVSRDPDVNMSRMFEDLAQHKTNQNRKIKKAFVVIAAWDKLKPKAQHIGFDLLDPVNWQRDAEDFVSACYPQFFAELHSNLRNDDIQYYPMFFQTEKEDNGKEKQYEEMVEILHMDGTLELKKTNRPHIIVYDIFDPEAQTWKENARKISYSASNFDRLITDVMQLAEARR